MLDKSPSDTSPTNSPSSKWGEAVNAGFQILPDMLLKHQKTLGLNATDLVVLINLTSYWWYADQKPFPRARTIANRMGSDVRTIQRSLKKLQKIGLIEKRKIHNERHGEQIGFYLDGLLRRLSMYAVSDPGYRSRIKVLDNAVAIS